MDPSSQGGSSEADPVDDRLGPSPPGERGPQAARSAGVKVQRTRQATLRANPHSPLGTFSRREKEKNRITHVINPRHR